MGPKFLETREAFRDWMETHHQSETELWMGYFKKKHKDSFDHLARVC